MSELRRRLAALEAIVRPVRVDAGAPAPDQVVLYSADAAPPVLPPRPDGLPWSFIPKNGRESGS